MAVTVEWESDEQRMERCDHEGTTEPLGEVTSISRCTECGKTWPTRLGKGAATGADRVEARRRLGGAHQLCADFTIFRTSASGTPAARAMAVIDQPSAWAERIASNHSRSARPSLEVACAISLIASATVVGA